MLFLQEWFLEAGVVLVDGYKEQTKPHIVISLIFKREGDHGRGSQVVNYSMVTMERDVNMSRCDSDIE